MIVEKIYTVNWKKLAQQLVKGLLFKPKQTAWLYALIATVELLHSDFILFRKHIKYRLGITPQVVYLEKLLNDRFDYSDRRITIVKVLEYAALPLYTKNENKPVRFYRKSENEPVVIYTKEETAQFSVDFIIKIPVFVQFDLHELMTYIADDVLPSKTYKVQIV